MNIKSAVLLILGLMLILGEGVAVPQEETEDIIKGIFDEIVDIYYDEDIDKFMSYFSEDDYPSYNSFEENMEYTFENNGELNLSIVIANLTVSGNSAIVRADWDKTWDDASSGSGTNNTIRLKKIEGAWKVIDVQNESIFVIGTGTFSSYMTE